MKPERGAGSSGPPRSTSIRGPVMQQQAQTTLPLPIRQGRALRSVQPLPPLVGPAGEPDPGALADLIASPGVDVASRARTALSPLPPHDALVLVTPASAGFPVQIAAPRGLREGLSGIDWRRMVEGGSTAEGTASRLPLAELEGELQLAGWVATSGHLTAALVVATRGRLEIDAAAQRAAKLIAMLAVARARPRDHDPS